MNESAVVVCASKRHKLRDDFSLFRVPGGP
jgi:hypothetical protein